MSAFLSPAPVPLSQFQHRLALTTPIQRPLLPTSTPSKKSASPCMVAINSDKPSSSSSPSPSPSLQPSAASASTPTPNCNDQSVPLASQYNEWKSLQSHKKDVIDNVHLRDLLEDEKRNDKLTAEHDGIFLDYSRQRVTEETMDMLFSLANSMNLQSRIKQMMSGKLINTTEDRAVLHTALRARRSDVIMLDGVNVVEQVHRELDRIRDFTNQVREGKHVGVTGKKIKNFIAVGIGGSYLGPDFVYEALKTDTVGYETGPNSGFSLHFLANVDPVDVKRALEGFNADETMMIIVSKTFTTRETLVNAKTIRTWFWEELGGKINENIVKQHVIACSTNVSKTSEFGIAESNVFPFWDWVGGRYSVSSSVGALPLSLMYGYSVFEDFLAGARSVDNHLLHAPLERNIPVIMGLIGVWNMSFLGYKSRAMHPYTEALNKLPAHIQQVDMESNGKHVSRSGVELDFDVGEVDFGEPGTLGQHSFFQLLHMGQTVPCTFIGFIESQNPTCQEGEPVSNHDELMSNFFAQPDALAKGKTGQECIDEGKPDHLIPHVTFSGNRPSLSLLLPVLNAHSCGQLLALFEHRTAVQGFVWDINSFDQWGVELGKVLATKVRKTLNQTRYHGRDIHGFNSSTTNLIKRYLSGSVGCAIDEMIED